MVKNIIVLSLLGMSLLACINCSSKPEVVGVSYSFTEWNYYTNDSINCSFKLDSSFQKTTGHYCFDDVSFCHIFSNNDCIIAINYYFLHESQTPYNLVEKGECETRKLRDSYPNIKIEKPWIGQQGILNTVQVAFSEPTFNGIDFYGFNHEYLAGFSIYMEGNDSVENMKKRMQLLVESISLNIVCH